MTDSRVDKLADVLVNYSTRVQPEDKVIIQGDVAGEPLIKAVYVKVLEARGLPLVYTVFPDMVDLLVHYGSDEQLAHTPEPVREIMETYDVRIHIGAADNTKALSGADPARMTLINKANKPLLEIFMRRAARGDLRWVTTIFPTHAFAQDAEMSLREYENFVYGACMPDLEDPVGYWRHFSAWQQKVVDWLRGKERVHVVGPETDLRLSIAGRTFINSDGRNNMPSGEVFTGPVEDSVEGHVTFSYPAIYQQREVTGIRLAFEQGRAVKVSAEKNQDFLIKTLDIDEGARYVGEFAIGTNEGISRFTGQILFDEKIGGSFHMAMGAGYPETGSRNESAIHWDMICDLRDGGEIWVDDELLYQNGAFVIDFP